MISDLLQRTVEQIDRYVRDCPECYGEPKFLARLTALRESIDNLRNEIDSGPVNALETMARRAGK